MIAFITWMDFIKIKKFFQGVLWGVIPFIFTSCHVSSRTAMYGSGGRTAYNYAAQSTTNEELLLNLVRLRYSDTPYFMQLNNVTTQFTYGGKFLPSIFIPGFNQNNPASLEGEFIWQSQPTIQYSPLQGKDFAIQLMHPLDLRIIQGLIYTGWDVDRVFRILVQSMAEIPNASSASGPIPQNPPKYKKFFEATCLMRHFQLLGELQIGLRYIPKNNISKVEKLEENHFQPNIIQISFPGEGEEAKALADLLEVTKRSGGKYLLSMRQDFNEKAEIGIMTRSLLGCMYYLSLGVLVPREHIEKGFVGRTFSSNETPFDWLEIVGDLITIYSSDRYPEEAFLSVLYRGHWFYIDDSDINSKRTFVLLQQIFNLQAKQEEQEAPFLTIPLGGGAQ